MSQSSSALPQSLVLADKVLYELMSDSAASSEDAQKVLDDLATAFEENSKGYRRLLYREDTIDFALPSHRYAYVFSYVVFLICAMEKVKDSLPTDTRDLLSTALKVKDFHAVCLGGGPGSDICGIISWLQGLSLEKRPSTATFSIFDKHAIWSETLHELFRGISGFHTSYKGDIDVTNPKHEPSQYKSTMKDANIITMIKFASAIYAQRHNGRTEEFLRGLLALARPGTLLVVIDNGRKTGVDNFSQWVCTILKEEWSVLSANDCIDVNVGTPMYDEMPIMNQIIEQTGRRPQLSGIVSYRILQKVKTE
ncbi:hypothetical protein HDU87_002347 [Geranomyces variabilis]|uniref:Uncharacterized protein n=1 Tax=Geranomyces variabilis TaxID=109894 RepID=A0AAD5TGD5_9FUNG|nr:hypothetical protein HDU87_002347 [Geranomyces variabilis]